MASLLDLCSKASSEALSSYAGNLKSEEDERLAKQRAIRDMKHNATHIFSSYDEALDWLVENPNKSVTWHAGSVSYIPGKNLFESYEPSCDLSSVIHFMVRKEYTKEEMLQRHHEHEQYLIEEYGDCDGLYDENGKLEYVYINLWEQ